MDTAQGVDVGWLQHSQKGGRLKTSDLDQTLHKTTSPSNVSSDPAPPVSRSSTKHRDSEPSAKQPAKQPKDAERSKPSRIPPSVAPTPPKAIIKRPGVLGRSSSERLKANIDPATSDPISASRTTPKASTPPNRRNSWISSLSSKFSSEKNQGANNATSKEASPTPNRPVVTSIDTVNPYGAAYSPQEHHESQDTSPISQSPKGGNPGFLTSALRRLSSGGSGLGRQAVHGNVCQRRIMNVDPHRERCQIPDFDQSKLKRVSFCVDVEIAVPTKHNDDDDTFEGGSPPSSKSVPEITDESKKKLNAQGKGEGAALKNPQVVEEEKETEGVIKISGEKLDAKAGSLSDDKSPTAKPKETKEPTKKQEKKKRSEEERKERKERRRRQAEANGMVPIEFMRDDPDLSSSTSDSAPKKPQHKPTTDPTRIYRRCCQLRESPVLKVVVEQISTAPPSAVAEAPGTVPILDLSDHTLKLTDVITLGDWLAVVPVRKLMLEHCGLTDESVRIILAGLLASKTMEQSRYNKKLFRQGGGPNDGVEKVGTIEKLSLKGNPQIGREGWRHIGLFINMSKSLKAINLSHNPIPQPTTSAPASCPPHQRPQNHHMHMPGHMSRTNTMSSVNPSAPISSLISRAITERAASNCLEEVVVDDCHLTAVDIGNIVDGMLSVGARRLGLASNGIDEEGFAHVARYISSGKCDGIDLAGNDMQAMIEPLAQSLNADVALQMLSLGYCGLTPTSLKILLPAATKLPNLRYLDLSHNHGLFEKKDTALSLLRRYVPKLSELRRIHLSDVEMTPEHAIAFSEVLPDCPVLCHITILENPQIKALASAKDSHAQEEACALYASLMTAARVSQTIISIEIDPPTQDSHEVIKALASQIVAYGLRNLSQGPFAEAYPDTVPANKGQIHVPDILLHIVGQVDGYDAKVEEKEAAPDDDYLISGTGVVKALGICLGSVDGRRRSSAALSRDSSPAPGNGTISPRKLSTVPRAKEKPRDMAVQLLDSARKIRARLRPVLIREDKAGNDMQWRRLHYLDTILQRMISRFEDEYPEFKETRAGPREDSSSTAGPSSAPSDSKESTDLKQSPSTEDLQAEAEADADAEADPDADDSTAVRLTRKLSSTSLASRALTSEEGRMHRFGQQIRRDILRPQTLDYAHGTKDSDPPEELHLTALREKLEHLRGDEIRERVELVGPDQVLSEIGANAKELLLLAKEDPEAFEAFREAHIIANTQDGAMDINGEEALIDDLEELQMECKKTTEEAKP